MDLFKQIFKNEFESGLEPIIDNGLVKIGSLTYDAADILRTDQLRYDTAFGEWKSIFVDENCAYCCESIDWLKSNKHRYEDLLEDLTKDYIVPFIGSGMSKPSGIPVWRELLLSFVEYCFENEREAIVSLVENSKFEDAASLIVESINKEWFDELIDQASRNSVVEGAVRLLPFFNTDYLITTNYDRILESVYDLASKEYSTYLGCDVSQIAVGRSEITRIIKLHGDHKNPNFRVLTKQEYNKFYDKRKKHIKKIISLLINNRLLFTGCSLVEDRTLEVIKKLHHKNSRLKHYALLQERDSQFRIQRERFLTGHGIYTIWYRGEHDMCIKAILTKLLKDCGKIQC